MPRTQGAIQDVSTALPTSQVEEGNEAPPQKVNFRTVLRNTGFRNLWLGQIISQVGDYFAFLAMTVVVSGFSTDAQSTTLAVTGMMLSFTLPRLLFGLLAGVFVDRWDRRRTMLVSDILRAGLVLLMIPAFMASSLPALYALGFLMSTVGAFFNPAKGALIPHLVPTEQLLSANSLSQTAQVLSLLLGPALAGITLKVAGTGHEWIAFVVDSASFVVSALAIWAISVPKHAEIRDQRSEIGAETSPVRKVWQELRVGFKALALNRTMATLTVIFSITMLGVGAINILWVVYLKTRFGFIGPELAWRLSLLDITFAIGMIIASVVAGNFMSHLAPKWFIVIALLGVGMSLAVYGYLPDYWLAAAGTVVMGAFVAPIETGVSTLMQIVVPNNLLGRVGGGFATVSDTASILSMSLAGVAGAALGIPAVFAIMGITCVAMGFASWAFLPPVTLKDKVEVEAEPLAKEGALLAFHEVEKAS